ncbi:hypothetical protein V495_01183 [Pseudogymnoascus sp. VKM F-4514 (FW-929)]|nr:hypothetical protein V495_01183 [Pseudogymnoascus sp. VKM F-4514 (FW-929)]
MRPPPPPPPLFALALFAQATAATFTLSHPLPFGSESTSQSQAPCGASPLLLQSTTGFYAPCGASPLLLQSTTGFYVGGDAVAVVSEGDGASILIRATISEDLGKANWTNLFPVVQQQGGGKFCEPLVLAPEEISEDLGKANWTNLFPVVQQQGGGKFCEPLVLAPEEWAGREGVVQVIESGEEGLSYQCAPVIFRSSRGGSIITLCSNGTDVTGIFGSDPRLPTDGAGINISSLSNFSAPADTTSGFAPGETAPGLCTIGAHDGREVEGRGHELLQESLYIIIAAYGYIDGSFRPIRDLLNDIESYVADASGIIREPKETNVSTTLRYHILRYFGPQCMVRVACGWGGADWDATGWGTGASFQQYDSMGERRQDRNDGRRNNSGDKRANDDSMVNGAAKNSHVSRIGADRFVLRFRF